MIKTFINRPVLSTVISIIILLLGVLGMKLLPVTQYPDIAPPTIKISAKYTGADAQTVLQSVIIPIEEQVNGVEDMTYITSSADNSGAASITVYFKQGVDPDIATVNVQNRVSRATPSLPSDVVKSGVVTQKQQTSSLMFLSFYSKNKAYDDVFIQNYLNINIIPAIKRINGVGDATVFGAKDYSMRIWLDPQKMSNFNLVPADVIKTINEQSTQAAIGQLGQNNGEAFQYVIKYSGKLNEVQQYEDIIVKAGTQSDFIRLKDIAKIELSAFSYGTRGETDGFPSLSMAVYQTPGSNAQIIIDDIYKYLESSKSSFPDGLEYVVNYDTNEFLDASIDDVMETLYEAFLLVFFVVFLFLQDFRSTLVPAIAVPVSLIGTLFILNMFGFSLNLLTLFALILAIGIVVDDAIVVVEAVHAKMEEDPDADVKTNTIKAMSGISGAIISITLVMAAVFIPVTFISGPSGVFYKQFGITLASAILISAINALTLSPTLCALFLKPHNKHGKKKSFLQRFYDAFNVIFASMTQRYGNAVSMIIKQKWIAFAIIFSAVGLLWWANKTAQTGFVPNEDRGIIFANVELPPGSSLDRSYNAMKSLQAMASKIDGVEGVSFIAGTSLLSGSGNNYGLAFLKLKDFKERAGKKEVSVDVITAKLFGMSSKIPDAKMIFFSPPSLPGFGVGSGFELQILDKTGGEPAELDANTRKYLAELNQRPEIKYAQSSFSTKYPQYEITINVPLAKQMGVSVSDIFSALGGYIGGIYAADFTKFGKQFRVMVQSLPESRNNAESLNNLQVRTATGQMAPVTQFATLNKVMGPQSMGRFNLFGSAYVSGSPNEGFSTGEAIKAVKEVAANNLPNGYDIDFSGLTREEINSGSQNAIIFLLTILFVYFILSAQYESYILPFTILLSLPIGVMGAFLSQKFAGLENNIFFQIALIMLIGLLAKNAILIVEFALHRRYNGDSITQAAVHGAKERLRPILMTSFAFILGLMPLVFSDGVGSLGNRSLATGAAFGLLIGTMIGIFVIPALFVVFQTIQEKIKPINTTASAE